MNKSALKFHMCSEHIHIGLLHITGDVCNALHGPTPPKISDFSSNGTSSKKPSLTTSVKQVSPCHPQSHFPHSILLSTQHISKPGFLGPLLMSVSPSRLKAPGEQGQAVPCTPLYLTQHLHREGVCVTSEHHQDACARMANPIAKIKHGGVRKAVLSHSRNLWEQVITYKGRGDRQTSGLILFPPFTHKKWSQPLPVGSCQLP